MTGNPANTHAAADPPELTDVERQALAVWAAKTSPKLTARTGAPLARLIEPILAATAGWPPVEAGTVRNLLLGEVHRRQQPYWAWDEDTWVELAGPPWRKAAATARPNHTRRLHVFALGHRVGGQRRLHARAGAWRLRRLADLLYGAGLVQAALDQVVATLAGWGSRRTPTTRSSKPPWTCCSRVAAPTWPTSPPRR